MLATVVSVVVELAANMLDSRIDFEPAAVRLVDMVMRLLKMVRIFLGSEWVLV